jgi:hypothetical protein
MTKKFHFKHIFTALILALSLAVALPTTMSVDAAGAKLNKTKVTVCTGKTYTLKMSGVSKKVSWTTSDKKVATIKTSGKNKATCKITAKKNGTATVTAKVKVGKKTKTFKCKVTVKGHSYGDATYQWSSDKSKCTATKECTRCHKKLTQTVKTSKKTTKKATCTENGKRTYTAKFTKYDFGTKKKNVSIKALGHSFDKVSYKWNASYSACTAKAVCGRCNASVSEKATVTSEVTKEATKDAEGSMTYTATFTNKDFATQTKDVTIPKVAYLEKEAIIIDYNNPMDVRVCNDTVSTIRFFDVSGNEVDGYNNALFYKIYGTISEDKTSIYFSTGYKTKENTLVAKITTTRGQVLSCRVSTKFVPGEYSFGDIHHMYQDTSHNRIYLAYGKNRGFYPAMSDWENYNHYAVDCNTKADYDAAYNFYHNQTYRDGRKCDLNQKAQEIESACSERRNYKSKAELEWEALSYEVQENTYGGDFFNYIREKYGEVGIVYHLNCGTGFQADITSNAQLKQIVDDWTRVSGEVPSSYYYTAFSDWAEWCGRDIGMLSYSTYDENLNFCTYTPPALPSNFRD